MARILPPKQPDETPEEQALVTPNRGDPMMQVHRDLGALTTEVKHLTGACGTHATDLTSLKSAYNKVIGGLIVFGLAIGAMGAVIWYFAGDKIHTLLRMAEERQVHDGADARNSAADNNDLKHIE